MEIQFKVENAPIKKMSREYLVQMIVDKFRH